MNKLTYQMLERDFLFSDGKSQIDECLRSEIAGKTILIIGGAGSIGAAVVAALIEYGPRALHVVDISENSLVRLVRAVRAIPYSNNVDFRTFVIDFGSPVFERYLNEYENFDSVLNFAACKHVRSERDSYSLLRLLEVNVLNVHRLMKCLQSKGVKEFFSVSSDKAVYPHSFLGASKRLMEVAMFSSNYSFEVSSARFANVAFSEGSLLESFVDRFDRGLPLAGPNDIKRYFISSEEAAYICLMATYVFRNKILVPKLDPEKDLLKFDVLAEKFLAIKGYRASFVDSFDFSKSGELDRLISKAWPCMFGASDSAGEKPHEEFFYRNELLRDTQLLNLNSIAPEIFYSGDFEVIVSELSSLLASKSSPSTNEKLLALIIDFLGDDFKHSSSNKSLDDKY